MSGRKTKRSAKSSKIVKEARFGSNTIQIATDGMTRAQHTELGRICGCCDYHAMIQKKMKTERYRRNTYSEEENNVQKPKTDKDSK